MWLNTSARLLNDPREITTKTGTQMAFCFVGAAIEGEDLSTFGIVGFDSLASELLRYRKGSTLIITGNLKANDWTGQDGTGHKGYQITLGGLAGIKRRSPVKEERQTKKNTSERPTQGEPFNDDLSF